MVTVRLSDNSSIRRLNINPKQEITREEGVVVPVKWAATRLSDSNLFFVFGEEDKEELSNLNERFLEILCSEMGKEDLTSKQLLEELLPAPKRTKAQTKPKTSLKK